MINWLIKVVKQIATTLIQQHDFHGIAVLFFSGQTT